jgi:hypothetical protein
MYLSSFSQGTNMYNFKQAQCRSKQMELDNRPTISHFQILPHQNPMLQYFLKFTIKSTKVVELSFWGYSKTIYHRARRALGLLAPWQYFMDIWWLNLGGCLTLVRVLE